MQSITIYCDGSSIKNPGPGGWGVVVQDGKKVHELGGAEEETTNNRMELTAAIEALRLLEVKAEVAIHTDSQYVINGITKWTHGWKQNGWQTKEKKDVLNKDLWQALMEVSEKHAISWEHVRGHAGVVLNERVDVIANGFARNEHVTLFEGTQVSYEVFLQTMPKPRMVAKGKKTGTAYSYVSLVDGKVATHKTWTDCEKHVKGKSAKYKKVFSKEEEDALISEWGG